jgi:hypothetical protein
MSILPQDQQAPNKKTARKREGEHATFARCSPRYDLERIHALPGAVQLTPIIAGDGVASNCSGCISRRTTKGPITRASIAVRAKQANASAGVATIGSPRTLNDVFTTSGQPDRSANAEIRL